MCDPEWFYDGHMTSHKLTINLLVKTYFLTDGFAGEFSQNYKRFLGEI